MSHTAKSRTRLSDFPFTFHFSLSHIGEGNGNPLQCSCLKNPRDREAWGAAIYGVTQSRTRLKRLSNSSSSSSNTAKARRTAQRHTEPIDTPKPTTGHCAALQRDEIQLHQLEHSHKLPQPAKHHRTLIQPHPRRQTLQPRRTTTLRTFFSFLSFKSHYSFPLHMSTFTLAFSSTVECSSLFFLLKTNKKKKVVFFFYPFTCDFSDFVFDIFDCFS